MLNDCFVRQVFHSLIFRKIPVHFQNRLFMSAPEQQQDASGHEGALRKREPATPVKSAGPSTEEDSERV